MHTLRQTTLGIAFTVAATMYAQAPATPRLDSQSRREVVDTVASQIERIYQAADTGRLIAAHLRQRLAAGAYDGAVDPADFARLVDIDVRAINGDRHLRVGYAPETPGQHVGPEGVSMRDPDPPVTVGERESDRESHYNLGRIDILDGNIGYLEMPGFARLELARDAVVAALGYLESTDAIIIDLRHNGGGDGELPNFLISHFVGADSVLVLRVVDRSSHDTLNTYTLARVPGPRRPDVPLYVLTSRGTGSAAEAFAFVLHNLGRATIVGARTAGAGHNVVFVDSGHGFYTGISFTRVMDPRTGREWEHVGVQPDTNVDPEQALLVAHMVAVRALAQRATGHRHDALGLIGQELDAQRHPYHVASETLAGYAGQYDQTLVTARGGHLEVARYGMIAEPIVTISDSVFARGATRFVFHHAAGKPLELEIIDPDGERIKMPRR